ncbi:dihydroneopterin aldolase [Bacillus alveayuensis]|jgi:7,8-dihydroneopterin aldolase/epimerase/oxygenase|uniref:dihydroneopterin aldolase n=1 Tax=Aeribacillus alveayuensis TaxID=279215 RepID=UPI0005D10ECB|nr:dihydroneopterin aldolase [Bacillus alveayuensis]
MRCSVKEGDKIDKIYINRMQFYGYHGVLPEENKLGQVFLVDLVIETDLRKAGQSDDLHDTINYAELYRICREIVEGEPFKLIEAVAEKIADTILVAFPSISNCTVKVIKPNPPIQGHYESVAVEIVRSR